MVKMPHLSRALVWAVDGLQDFVLHDIFFPQVSERVCRIWTELWNDAHAEGKRPLRNIVGESCAARSFYSSHRGKKSESCVNSFSYLQTPILMQ